MGDGRYYTFYQFFSVITLVLLAMFVLGSMLMSYYRNKDKRDRKDILLIFALYILVIIFRTIECVIPSYQLAHALRYLQLVGFIGATILLFYYLFVKKQNIIKGINKILEILLSGIIFLLTIGAVSKGSLLIKSYGFLFTEYSVVYVILIVIFLVVAFMAMIKTFYSKEKIHRVYKNSTLAFIIFLVFVLPILAYIGLMIMKFKYLYFVELLLYFMMSIALNISIYSESEFGLTARAFDKIGDMITDYIFVIGLHGNIIYKNQSVIKSNLFTKKETIHLSDITEIYDGKILTEKSHLGKEYIKLIKNEEKHYLTHKRKILKNGDQVIGSVITVTNITKLMDLLYYLEDRKKVSKDANDRLNNYSKVVYHLEKEREINTLLEEIITSRESDMESLILKIKELEYKINEDNLEELIDQAIQYNGVTLDNVRKAVTTYRQHYGG